jgi:ElaB/YqjD/DUF883 family membrane-anchored ribosome-binding protein
MATAQSAPSTSVRGNGKDQKAFVATAVKQDLRDAKHAAGDFASAVKSSATHFGDDLQQRVTKQAARAVQKFHGARTNAQDRVRERPLAAIGFAAAAGILLGILTRR